MMQSKGSSRNFGKTSGEQSKKHKQVSMSWKKLPSHISNPNPNLYLKENWISLDFETTNINFGDSREAKNSILIANWQLGKDHPNYTGKRKSIRGGEYDLAELVDDVEAAGFLIAHNAKFELGWLVRCGVDLTKVVVWCTQIAEFVIAGNRRWGLTLEDCLKRRGYGGKDFVGSLIRLGVDPLDIPRKWLEEYCSKDVTLTTRLFRDQRRTVFRRSLEAATFTRCLLTPVLTDIERRGMCIDRERVETVYRNYSIRFAKLEREFAELTGGINFNSPKQVAEYLYDTLGFEELKDFRGNPKRTKADGRKTDGATLTALKAKNKKQREFIRLKKEINKYKDALTKTLTKFNDCAKATKDGILFANLNQTIAQTHRLASSGTEFKVQFQNIDRNFKPLVTSRRNDWLFAEHDFAQLEYRTAVFLGSDENGRRNIADPTFDAHVFSASVMNGLDYDETFKLYKAGDKEVKQLRQDAKADTFKPLYGGQSGSKSQKRYYQTFRETYGGITSWQEKNCAIVADKKQLRIPGGLIFYWPHARYSSDGYFNCTTQVCNYPVQSFATADIVPISVVYLWHRIRAEGLDSFIVNTVHDSVLSEVPNREKASYDKLARCAFEQDTVKYMEKVYGVNFDVPLEAEGEFNTHWGTYSAWEETYLQN